MVNGTDGASFGEGEAALLVSGEDLLARDNIPDENQQLTCFSCGTTYIGLYCHACGQKNDNLRRSLFSLIVEMAGNITAFDSRIWRTWLKLLTRPGIVAREYADGSRTKWTSPVRAYLAMSILLFGYIALTGTQILSVTMDVERDEGAPEALSELKPSQLSADFQILMFETTSSLAEKREASNIELVDFLLNYPEPLTFNYEDGTVKMVEKSYERPSSPQRDEIRDAINEAVEASIESGIQNVGDVRENMQDALDKIETASSQEKDVRDEVDSESRTDRANEAATGSAPDPNVSIISLNGQEFSPEEASSRAVAALKLLLARPQVFNDYFSTYLPRVMLCMMPFTMFLGILFIRGRGNALLYDHLVHTAYIHAVFFFLLFIGLILGQHTPIPPLWLMALLTLYMLLYLPMSLSGMFRRGPIKTVWTSYAIGFVYFLTMMIVLVTLTVMAVIGVIEQTEFISFSN